MKKTVDYYMSLPYRLEIIPDSEEGGYAAQYPELRGCVTCADTIEELVANAEDAKRVWIEAALEEGIDIPMPSSMTKYSGQLRLRMPKELHRHIAERAREEGISMNQFCIYMLSKA